MSVLSPCSDVHALSPGRPTSHSVDVRDLIHNLAESTVGQVVNAVLDKGLKDGCGNPASQPGESFAGPRPEVPSTQPGEPAVRDQARPRPEVFSRRVAELEVRVSELTSLLETRSTELNNTRHKLAHAENEAGLQWKEGQLAQRALREALNRATTAEGLLVAEQEKNRRLESDKKNLVVRNFDVYLHK
jgi:hypothetical protein